MKYARYGAPGREKVGVVDPFGDIHVLPLDIDLTPAAIADGRLPELSQSAISKLPVVSSGTRLGPCIAQCGKIVAVGLNYADHVTETHAVAHSDPTLFLKSPTAICGPTDTIIIPPGATKVDWEVELAVIISKTARAISEADASMHIFGYTILNDVSERSYQLEGSGQWTKGKSSDTFAPIGPWLVTPDEISDPQDLNLWLDVNNKRYQESNTRFMLTRVTKLISYISAYMTLEPGDVISTGTPAGVGLGQTPPRFLQTGDVVHLGIDGLGTQNLKVQ